MAKYKKIQLDINQPCICGSEKSIAACHLDTDGRLRKPLPNINPPSPNTGYAHNGCYLNRTKDCSEKISKEHYISRSIIDQLGSVIRMSGASWLQAGETLDTTVDNLTAKVLCTRHNSALSPLDDEAAHFFFSFD
ncbi:MAG: hypothetical protein SFW65_05080 [Alphaproteobacteria bacterium]|nr:hypothetical protein [Alphaproteobacteria bacterium]